MKLIWEPSDADAALVQELVQEHAENPFVQLRRRTNLEPRTSPVTISEFWQSLVACLLTTQQRSGPGSPIQRFLCQEPFPLRWEACAEREELAAFAAEVLTSFGGIRRCRTMLPDQIETNRDRLRTPLGEECLQQLSVLEAGASLDQERAAARLLAKHLKGIGPKQARNLLQVLGLTRWVVPLDSRFAKWLRKLPFPVSVSANSLSDESYYTFVEDGIAALCRAADVVPCVLDACVFVDGESRSWDAEKEFWA